MEFRVMEGRRKAALKPGNKPVSANIGVKPILFSTDMVIALQEGRKTQTRRVMRPQPQCEEYGGRFARYATDLGFPASREHFWAGFWLSNNRDGSPGFFKCPYGRPGDLLWVRERFRLFNAQEECICYEPCNCSKYNDLPLYYADNLDDDCKWKPSIHMPRWASRITLRITDIRVEHLQDISKEDAIAEGLHSPSTGSFSDYYGVWNGKKYISNVDPLIVFRLFWDSINAKRGFCWAANPWVWVIKFDVIEENINSFLENEQL